MEKKPGLVKVFGQDRVSWFINIRWFAVIGVVTAIVFSQHLLKLLPNQVTPYLWMGAGLLFFANISFLFLKNRIHDSRRFILFQMISDLSILTYLLHFSGGLENPLFIIFILHIIIAGILLSKKDAYSISFTTALLFLLLALSEYTGIIPHYAIGIFGLTHNLPCLSGISLSFILLLFGTAYFTTTIMGHLRSANQKLIESEKLMVLGQITGYIAHEVNNPVMIISSKAKLALSMKDIPIPEVIREKLMVIDKYAERIAGVVKGLLGFLKPRQELQMSYIDINRIIVESLNLVEARIRQSRIEVDKSFDWDIPSFRSRFYEMAQVFVNLFDNAIDAMPAGGRLRIKTSFNKYNGITITISDTGTGIAKENLSKIFEPLFTTKQDEKGIGLGLSFVQSIIKLYNGTISVKSNHGAGAVFTINIPIEKAEMRVRELEPLGEDLLIGVNVS